jgi:16S rRNA (adenine1518-N6/adenine1519-N6)-dimethyltransferase
MQKELYSLILKYGFKPNSKLDQNFIINKEYVDRVVKYLNPNKNETILEIGPGTGSLTKKLLEKFKKVIVIEKDKLMTDILKKEINSENITIINEDFLETDLNKLNFDKIVGFIPYSISHKIINKINGTKHVVFVVQKEFADKLVAIEGFNNYVAISVLAQTYGDIKIKALIKKSAFFPVPKVDSAIITIDPNNKKVDMIYNKFIKSLFRYPNKNLFNALKLSQKIDTTLFNNINIQKIDENLLNKKIKTIKIDEYIKIYKQLFFS